MSETLMQTKTLLISAGHSDTDPGPGTGEAVCEQITHNADRLAKYQSVYDTRTREISDGDGGFIEHTPPFKFDIMAGA
jgi:hypothetical protein